MTVPCGMPLRTGNHSELQCSTTTHWKRFFLIGLKSWIMVTAIQLMRLFRNVMMVSKSSVQQKQKWSTFGRTFGSLFTQTYRLHIRSSNWVCLLQANAKPWLVWRHINIWRQPSLLHILIKNHKIACETHLRVSKLWGCPRDKTQELSTQHQVWQPSLKLLHLASNVKWVINCCQILDLSLMAL